MKANELRIGNLVFEKYSGTMIVMGIGENIRTSGETLYLAKQKKLPSGLYSMETVAGIELTEEWLLKFGFEIGFLRMKYKVYRLKTKNGYSNWFLNNNGLMTKAFYSDNGLSEYYIRIKYVHQLQNLYFALTGEELTPKP